jgi:hypothetical protein
MSDGIPTAKAVNLWLAMKNVRGYRSMKVGTSINLFYDNGKPAELQGAVTRSRDGSGSMNTLDRRNMQKGTLRHRLR